MNAGARAHPEPVDRFPPGTGSGLSEGIVPALERAREWAGEGLRALIVSGSHARGEAVWAELDGRRVSLSDLDLYAVMRDDAACAAARARADASAGGADPAMQTLAGALEVAFVTRDGLARMAARPGTVALARSGRVVVGDPSVLTSLPRWEPAEVSGEERLLLLENRAFELLWAFTAPAGERGVLLARHAVLKTALDLAAARTLTRGELPPSAAECVARARELGPPAAPPSWLEHAWTGLEPLWRSALACRGGALLLPVPAAEAAADWRTAARAWCATWWAESDQPWTERDPWARALGVSARGSLPRRLRRSLAFRARTGATPGLALRLRHAPAGTPQHRIHGCATVLVLAAAHAPGEPRLPGGALHALGRLGVTRASAFDEAATDALRAWDRQLHDGQRTADAS